jgi:hypothetical protein
MFYGMYFASCNTIITKMTTVYIILKVIALLGVILAPLAGPEQKKEKTPIGLSNICVNEGGFLEYIHADPERKKEDC